MSKLVTDFRDLHVFQISMVKSMDIFHLTKGFPKEEKYSLTDQIRRSSRSVSANIAEAWRKRRYRKSFLYTMNVAESEATETRVWLEYSYKCGYMEKEEFMLLDDEYDKISAMLYKMMNSADRWAPGTNGP
jgi:four helix bundle protein